MTGNEPNAHFCQECNAPLTSHAATAPLARVFASGHVYQKAVSRPQSRIVVIGIWLIVGPIFLLNLRALWYLFLGLIYLVYHFPRMGAPNYSFVTLLLLFLFVLGIETLFAAILVKVTRNYRRDGR